MNRRIVVVRSPVKLLGWAVTVAAVMMLTNFRCFAADEAPTTVDLNPFRACGLNCLFVVAKMHGLAATLSALGREVAPRANGDSSIADLERASTKLGLKPISARLGMGELRALPLPAIVHLKTPGRQSDSSHYVVLIGLHRQGVILIDPPAAATLHPYAEFAEDWTGVAVAFPEDEVSRNRFLATLRQDGPWAVWLPCGAGAVVLGGLAWLMFRGPCSSWSLGRMVSTR